MSGEPHICFTVSETSYLRNLDRDDLRQPCFAVHYQKPPKHNDETGTTSFSLNLPVLVITLYLENQEDVARKVAGILNKHWSDE